MNKKAFTLLEILMVVMIVGVLAAVAVPRVGEAMERFRAQEAIHLIQSIAAAQERYFIEYGEYYEDLLTETFTQLDLEIPPLRYFAFPVNGGTTGAWGIFINRSNNGYQLWTNKVVWPNIYCSDEPGGPNAQALCNAIGLVYTPSVPPI